MGFPRRAQAIGKGFRKIGLWQLATEVARTITCRSNTRPSAIAQSAGFNDLAEQMSGTATRIGRALP